jgi:hypothetical protein
MFEDRKSPLDRCGVRIRGADPFESVLAGAQHCASLRKGFVGFASTSRSKTCREGVRLGA